MTRCPQPFQIALLVALASVAIPRACIATESPDRSYRHLVSVIEALKSYQVTVDDQLILQPSAPGAKPRIIKSTSNIFYKSPNMFSFKNDTLMGGGSLISDGKTEYQYSALSEEYVVRRAPSNFVDGLFSGISQGKVNWLSANHGLVDGVSVTELHGSINGGAFPQAVTLDFNSRTYLPVRAVISSSATTSATGSKMQITHIESFVNQRIDAQISNSVFNFSPPQGASKVDSLTDLSSAFGGSSPN